MELLHLQSCVNHMFIKIKIKITCTQSILGSGSFTAQNARLYMMSPFMLLRKKACIELCRQSAALQHTAPMQSGS